MAGSLNHRWDLSPREAAELQRALAARVVESRPPWGRRFKGLTVAGADVSCPRGSRRIRAAVVVLRLPGFDVLHAVRVERAAAFPYVPGLLSFREAPVVIEAFRRLPRGVRREVDALVCDGQGLAHPRGLGFASHIGLLLEVPTIGCAKSRLCGDYEEPGPERGEWSPLTLDGRLVGRVVRTRANVRPLFVSVGHMTDLEGASDLVLRCAARYRLPEPTRLAHHAAGFRGPEEELLEELRRMAGRARQ